MNFSNFKKECISYFEKNTHRNEPIVFVGGFPRSGTTLMRVMLDAHPDIRCGEETHIIPDILETSSTQWLFGDGASDYLINAGITKDVIDYATSSFIYEIISRHGKKAQYLCNKDPFILRNAIYLSKLFPQSKFILMIRDARGCINSILMRKIRISGLITDNIIQSFRFWNDEVAKMHSECLKVGAARCLPVYYENLVLKPKEEMEKILKFLNIPWNDAVLNHEKYIGTEVKLNKFERSSDQVIKPIYLEGLYAWKNNKDILNIIDKLDMIAPVFKSLGYNSRSNWTNYGEANMKGTEKALNVQTNRQNWFQVAKKLLFST